MPSQIRGYNDALDFILAREHFGIKLGLENISNFLNSIDKPHNNFKSVHIAGTNGKGSTAAHLESIVRQAGYKTGIFTSPHLVDFRERIRVDGKQISKQYITAFVRKHKRTIEKHQITFFEVCTALAFSYFAYKKVDLAIVEVGLGGRLDATNTLHPLISVITDISFDHTNLLGDTLEKIAWEKAGIVKTGIPVYTGLLPAEAARKVKNVCIERSAPYFKLKRSSFVANGQPYGFHFSNNDNNVNNLKSSLPGKHQVKNAALAVQLGLGLKQFGYKINKSSLKKGLKNTCWPGRFEIIKSKNKPTIILDVGHNPAGVAAMVDTLKTIYPGRKAHLIMGFVRFKSLKEIIRTLEKIAKSAEVCHLQTYRGTPPEDISVHFTRGFPVNHSNSIAESYHKVIKMARSDDIILVCGSHFAVGEFMAEIKIKA